MAINAPFGRSTSIQTGGVLSSENPIGTSFQVDLRNVNYATQSQNQKNNQNSSMNQAVKHGNERNHPY